MSVLNPGFQQSFPYSPDYMSWEDWNGNFILWYGQETVPYHTEDDWQTAAAQIMMLPIFSNYPVPDPKTYDNWQNWAKEFRLIINGESH